MCSHPTERVFGQHQWQALRTKLATWRVNNFSSVIFRIIISYAIIHRNIYTIPILIHPYEYDN